MIKLKTKELRLAIGTILWRLGRALKRARLTVRVGMIQERGKNQVSDEYNLKPNVVKNLGDERRSGGILQLVLMFNIELVQLS